MAHESFENSETAKIMNENFINIKVDRGKTVILILFQKKFSYFDWSTRRVAFINVFRRKCLYLYRRNLFSTKEIQGQPSFSNVLINVSKVYQENRDKILNQAVQMKEVFRNMNQKILFLNKT